MVQQLVKFARHFNEPVVHLDRFCNICFKAYSSRSYPEYALHHNEPQVLAAAADQADMVISVHFIDGWAAVEEAQLPPHIVEYVQVSSRNQAYTCTCHMRPNHQD
jgi:hypothetical protein